MLETATSNCNLDQDLNQQTGWVHTELLKQIYTEFNMNPFFSYIITLY